MDERYEEGGYKAMMKLIDSKKLPRAVVCAYDRLAFGAMRALSDRNLSVPDDVAIIGIDDAPQSAYLSPSLSSINHEIEDTCAKVVDAILKKIRGEECASEIFISCKTVHRESSKIR